MLLTDNRQTDKHRVNMCSLADGRIDVYCLVNTGIKQSLDAELNI